MIEPSAAIIVVICQLVEMEARPTEIQFEEEDSENLKGLFVPSGSLCKVIFLAEKIFRKVEKEQRFLIDRKNANDQLVYFTMSELQDGLYRDQSKDSVQMEQNKLFLDLESSKHYITTSFGASPDNHMFSFIKLILRKFFALRIKKSKKDHLKTGNMIHRTRIFSGV